MEANRITTSTLLPSDFQKPIAKMLFYSYSKQLFIFICTGAFLKIALSHMITIQSRIIGAVRGAHSQLRGTTIPVCFPYDPRKNDKRFGTPAFI